MDGTGTRHDPYLILTESDLTSIPSGATGFYQLCSDISLSNPWVPIRFLGVFDGMGFTISNIEVNASSTGDHYGFFAQLTGLGLVRRLNLITSEAGISGPSSKYGGVLAGFIHDNARIEDVSARGNIHHGGDRGSGLIGYAQGGAYIFRTATFVKTTGSSRGGSVVSGGVNSRNWGNLGGVYSDAYSGVSGTNARFSGTDLPLSSIADPQNYPSYFDFSNEWEIVDGFPVVRKVPPYGPDAAGIGYLAGDFPGGVTTVNGVPVAASIRVLYRPGSGERFDGAVVATAESAPDGTWRIDNLNTDMKYDVVGRKAGFNDVIMANVSPKVL